MEIKYLAPSVNVFSVHVAKVLCSSDNEVVRMHNYLDEDNLDW